MTLDGVVLLAGHTARAQAYLQAMIARDLLPEHVIVLGNEDTRELPASSGAAQWEGIVLPDLGEALIPSCQRAGIRTTVCAARDVNAQEVAQAIATTAARVVVYGGYGGQIVAPHVLGLGARFLHMHSGWLPAYRGSTTLYYALLNGDQPGVTALLLDATIDTGPVVARRHYPRPPRYLDVDHVYDSAIRADLLVRVLQDYAATGDLPSTEAQDDGAATTYYVIHPVLKHLAILSLRQETAS